MFLGGDITKRQPRVIMGGTDDAIEIEFLRGQGFRRFPKETGVESVVVIR